VGLVKKFIDMLEARPAKPIPSRFFSNMQEIIDSFMSACSSTKSEWLEFTNKDKQLIFQFSNSHYYNYRVFLTYSVLSPRSVFVVVIYVKSVSKTKNTVYVVAKTLPVGDSSSKTVIDAVIHWLSILGIGDGDLYKVRLEYTDNDSQLQKYLTRRCKQQVSTNLKQRILDLQHLTPFKFFVAFDDKAQNRSAVITNISVRHGHIELQVERHIWPSNIDPIKLLIQLSCSKPNNKNQIPCTGITTLQQLPIILEDPILHLRTPYTLALKPPVTSGSFKLDIPPDALISSDFLLPFLAEQVKFQVRKPEDFLKLEQAIKLTFQITDTTSYLSRGRVVIIPGSAGIKLESSEDFNKLAVFLKKQPFDSYVIRKGVVYILPNSRFVAKVLKDSVDPLKQLHRIVSNLLKTFYRSLTPEEYVELEKL